MDDITKWAKWAMLLSVAGVPGLFLWASFVSLNPLIRRQLLASYQKYLLKSKSEETETSTKTTPPKTPKNNTNTPKASPAVSATAERRIAKLANFVSSGFLWLATADNNKVPKDYVLLYVWINYYCELNPPSASDILVSPTILPFLKVSHYKLKRLQQLYANKEFIIFPLIFAQILSNYLTPTKYKLNQRYLSSSIKKYLLNPIWINYSLGFRSHTLNWLGLLKSYLKHNAYLVVFFAATSFKSKFLDAYYAVKYKVVELTVWDVSVDYARHVFHQSNSIVNFLYVPNLVLMLLISVSALSLHANTKTLFKAYIKSIGVVSALSTLYLKETYSSSSPISKGFLNALNLYFFRLIVLSKWRIIKENHPWFRLLRLKTWNRIEAVVMCYGVWKVMNLNSFLRSNRYLENTVECEKLESETLIRAVDRVM